MFNIKSVYSSQHLAIKRVESSIFYYNDSMLSFINILVFSMMALGKDLQKPAVKAEVRFVASNEEFILLNQERLKYGLSTIGDETLVDEIIQDELDSQLTTREFEFSEHKKSEPPMPLMEKWGSRNKLRSECRAGSMQSKLTYILLEEPERKKEALEFYKKYCLYDCKSIESFK